MLKSVDKKADLTGYASLMGRAFEHKVDLLSKLLHDAHYPSLGRYKERLLADALKAYLPERISVGTGFVLFPVDSTKKYDADPLNMADHRLSRQCDIIVYDSHTIPPVFRDGDFVVLRPDCVKAVIEVKGALNSKELQSVLDGSLDFGRKWQATQMFYREHNQDLVPKPTLLCMAWTVARNKKNACVLSGTSVRKTIADFYRRSVGTNRLRGLPVLDTLAVYGDYEIQHMSWIDSTPVTTHANGWATVQGQFIRYDAKGTPYLAGDRTISSLLASVQYAVGDHFNRFFSYHDEVKRLDVLPHRYQGFEPWLAETEHIAELQTDFPL